MTIPMLARMGRCEHCDGPIPAGKGVVMCPFGATAYFAGDNRNRPFCSTAHAEAADVPDYEWALIEPGTDAAEGRFIIGDDLVWRGGWKT